MRNKRPRFKTPRRLIHIGLRRQNKLAKSPFLLSKHEQAHQKHKTDLQRSLSVTNMDSQTLQLMNVRQRERRSRESPRRSLATV